MTVPLGAGTWAVQLVAVGVLAGSYGLVYGFLVREARRRPGGRRVGISHVLPFVLGVALLVFAGVPPLSREADSLLSAHMVQHVLLADVASALIVLGLRAPVLSLGLPRRVLRLVAPRGRYGQQVKRLTSPVVVVASFAAMQWAWSSPPLLEASQRSAGVHLLQHALLFYSGLLLWWIVIDPLGNRRHQPRASRLIAIGASRLATVAVCLPLTFLDRSLYPEFAASASARGFDALSQQQIAGAAMCLMEVAIFGVALATVLIDVLSRDQRAEALRDPARTDRPPVRAP